MGRSRSLESLLSLSVCAHEVGASAQLITGGGGGLLRLPAPLRCQRETADGDEKSQGQILRIWLTDAELTPRRTLSRERHASTHDPSLCLYYQEDTAHSRSEGGGRARRCRRVRRRSERRCPLDQKSTLKTAGRTELVRMLARAAQLHSILVAGGRTATAGVRVAARPADTQRARRQRPLR